MNVVKNNTQQKVSVLGIDGHKLIPIPYLSMINLTLCFLIYPVLKKVNII